MRIARLILYLVGAGVATTLGGGCVADREHTTDLSGGGDTTLIEARAPSCSTCSLEVIDSVRLGSTTDREIPLRVPKQILRDGRGVYSLVFNGWGDKPILRYDSTGRFLGRLGTNGRGPGEYEMTSTVFLGPGDSQFVFAEGRLQVFGSDGAYGRVLSPVTANPIGVGRDGSVLATRFRGFPGTRGPPHVLRLDPAGRVRDSFPIFHAFTGTRGTVRAGKQPPHEYERTVEATPVVGPDGSVWTYLGVQARFEHHDSTGRVDRLLGLDLPDHDRPILTAAQADSFRERGRRAVAGALTTAERERLRRTPARGTKLAIDSAGLLWIARLIAAPGSDTITVIRERLAPYEAPEEETVPRDIEDRLSHTIIDVVDPGTGTLLARRELPFLGLLIRPGYVGRVTTDDDGHYVVHSYRLRLTRR